MKLFKRRALPHSSSPDTAAAPASKHRKENLIFAALFLLPILALVAFCLIIYTPQAEESPFFAYILQPADITVLDPQIEFRKELTITLPRTADPFGVHYREKLIFSSNATKSLAIICRGQEYSIPANSEISIEREWQSTNSLLILIMAAPGPSYDFTLCIENEANFCTVQCTGLAYEETIGTFTAEIDPSQDFRISLQHPDAKRISGYADAGDFTLIQMA